MALHEQSRANGTLRLGEFGPQQFVGDFAESLRFLPAVHFFHSSVPKNDSVIEIASDDVGQIEHLRLFESMAAWRSRASCERRRSVISRAMEEMPMIWPAAFLIGETVRATSMATPSFRMRTVSKWRISPFGRLRSPRAPLWPCRREEPVKRLAEHFGFGVAERPLGAGIPTDDKAVEIFANDGVIGGVDDGCEKGTDFLGLLDVSNIAQIGGEEITFAFERSGGNGQFPGNSVPSARKAGISIRWPMTGPLPVALKRANPSHALSAGVPG